MSQQISEEQLVQIMLYELAAFNDEGVDLNEDTIHNEVLSDDDGFGAGSSKNVYKGSIDWVLWNNDYPHKNWPSNWLTMSVSNLANSLLQ